jgi:peptide/nickel transport system permease protein
MVAIVETPDTGKSADEEAIKPIWIRRWARAILNELSLLLRTSSGRIGVPLVALHLFIAIVGGSLTPYPHTEFHLEHRLEGPSLEFLLGTDQFGRDLLSRILSGATSIIMMSVVGSVFGIVIGTAIGISSGYKGGMVDEVVMRIMDGFMSFPGLLLALLVATIARQLEIPLLSAQFEEKVFIVITIAVVFIPRVARVLRSAALTIKELEFVQSARLRGEPGWYIVFREILPNTAPVLGVEASVRLSYAILLASSLGFLGLGVQPPSPDWGRMINESRQFITTSATFTLVPAIAIATLVIGINLVADGLREAHQLPKESPQ